MLTYLRAANDQHSNSYYEESKEMSPDIEGLIVNLEHRHDNRPPCGVVNPVASF